MSWASDNPETYHSWRALKPGDQVYVVEDTATLRGDDGGGDVASRWYGNWSLTDPGGYTLRTITGTGIAAGQPYLDYNSSGVVRVIASPDS